MLLVVMYDSTLRDISRKAVSFKLNGMRVKGDHLVVHLRYVFTIDNSYCSMQNSVGTLHDLKDMHPL